MRSLPKQQCVPLQLLKKPLVKKFNYTYYLLKDESSFRICKSFYLSTLAVSQKMVYNVHQKKDKVSGVLKEDGRSKHGNHHKVTDEERKDVNRPH